MGMVVWPFIAGGADTRAPRALAVPALLCMAAGLVWFSFVPSTSESWADYLIVLPGLLLIGVGIGAVFPSINVGAMGSVSGPELGLASGIVNTARQLGAAFGVALLVATVITASDYTLDSAREDIQDANDRAELPPALAQGVGMRKFSDYVGQSTRRFDPGPGFDELAAREAAGAARNAFGWGFRIAALLVLLAVPFARRMVRTPAAARAADAKAREAAATGAPPGAAASPPTPATQPASPPTPAPVTAAAVAGRTRPNGEVAERIQALESSLAQLRSEVGNGDSPTTDGDAQTNGEGQGALRRKRARRLR